MHVPAGIALRPTAPRRSAFPALPPVVLLAARLALLLLPVLQAAWTPARAAPPAPIARAPAPAQPALHLRPVATIPLPGVQGRIDHMALDLRRRHLFVAALGNHTVEVLDLREGRRWRTMRGWSEPQGVCHVPGSDRLFVADGDGRCVMLDAVTLHIVRTIRFPDGADNLRLDPAGRRVYVGFGSGGLGMLDADRGDSLGRIALPAHPEAFQPDTSGSRIYVNVPGKSQVIVLDPAQRSIVGRWSLGGASGNFPMALDADRHLLVVGCRRPAQLITLDTRSGEVVQALPLGGDCDDVYIDERLGCLLATCGQGLLELFQSAPDGWAPVDRVPTAHGARTSLYRPELGRIFVAVPRRSEREPAEIRVFEVARR